MEKRMNKYSLMFIAAIVLLVVACGAYGQSGSRPVRFKAGTTETTVSGSLRTKKSGQTYLVRVKKGQSLHAEQANERGQSIRLTILDPNGTDVTDHSASCDSSETVDSTVAGTYKLIVSNCEKADFSKGSYKLKIEVK
jgi:arylamine N-acetyltransferase